LTRGSGIGKKSGFESADHISESLGTIFWVKNTLMHIRIRDLFDPGSGMEKFGCGIRDKHPEA
jgi:hypothetical protein